MNRSLSTQVYDKLLQLNKPILDGLEGKLISFNVGERRDVLALVLSINQGQIFYKVVSHLFQKSVSFNERTGIIEPVFVKSNPTTYIFDDGVSEQTFQARKVFTTKPFSVSATHLVEEFSLFSEDGELDRILGELGTVLPESFTLDDLKCLTSHIYNSFTLRNPEDKSLDGSLPIGKVIKNFGPACRHLAALEYLILILNDIPAELVATPKQVAQTLNESHSFNNVFVDGKWFIADPTNALVFSKCATRYVLEQRGKKTGYHLNAEPLSFVFNYSLIDQ